MDLPRKRSRVNRCVGVVDHWQGSRASRRRPCSKVSESSHVLRRVVDADIVVLYRASKEADLVVNAAWELGAVMAAQLCADVHRVAPDE